MSDRSSSVWRPIAWLRTADSERLALAIVSGGLAVTLAAIALGGFVQFGSGAISLLYTVATALPVIGAVLAAGALWWGLSALEPAEPRLASADPPERGSTRTNQPVARETIWTLERAASNWYHCRNEGATSEVRDRLTAGAVRALRSKGGLEDDRAREAVRSGAWTDDRVASAFLADARSQPIGERLRGLFDPGAAFDRRLRRTLAAIEAIDDEPRLHPPKTPESASASGTDPRSIEHVATPETASDSTAADSSATDSSEPVQEVAR